MRRLLGQTVREESTSLSSSSKKFAPIGMIEDYEVDNNNLLSTNFLYTQF